MSTHHSRSRRDFLSKLTSAVGGGAALAATSTVIQAKPIETPESIEPENTVTKGYQHTEHVETYYRLADF